MNEKFFSLPQEKQQAILNGGYRVFSQNSYRKSPISEIAAEAGISKSLLFHYFRNKKELYLYLWEHCAEITIQTLRQYGCYEKSDLFETMCSGLKAKVQIMRQYPYLGAFVLKAYYEQDPEIAPAIQASYQKHVEFKTNAALLKLDPSRFREGLDLQMMCREMYWASVGYLWENIQGRELDLDQMEQNFTELIEFWKEIYLRKEE